MRKTNINNYLEDSSTANAKKATRSAFWCFKSVLSFLFKMLLGLLCVCVVAGIIVGTSIVMYIVDLSNEPTGIDLRARKLNLTSYIYVYDNDGNPQEYQQLYSNENRVWVDYKDIPKHMTDAIIAIEDKRFLEHKGVDWVRTGGAVISLATGKDSYGGSTLTQQLIKNITKDNEASITRKLREVFRALKLEKEYSKDEIIEAYLNIVNFGGNNGGIQAAANMYFDKDIQDCSIAECAAIAGITQNPSLYNPIYYPEYNKKRREIVIGQMYEQGKITKSEYKQAMLESENMKFAWSETEKDEEDYDPDEESNSTQNIQNWYIDAMIRQLEQDIAEKYNTSIEVAEEKLYTEGLKIYCAVDLDMQKYAENYFLNWETPYDENIEAGYTMIGMDGRIIATVGSRNEKTGNLLFDRANTAALQPGSTIKPIGAYPLTIENSIYNFSSPVVDQAIEEWDYTDGYWKPGPHNWYGYYVGQLALCDAIEWSSNAAAARALQRVGVANSYSFVTGKLGFSHLAEQDGKNLAGLSIGGLNGGVTVTEMASAYSIYGTGGRYYKPYTYYYVTDQNDNIVLDNRDNYSVKALSEETAYIMNRLLNYNVNNSTHTRAGYTRVSGWDTIGKTGTTDENKDSWFCGLSPICAAAIWTGYDNPQTINAPNYAVDCWQDLMEHYLSDKSVSEYKVCENVTTARFCKTTGLLAGDKCKNTGIGYYTQGNMPSYCEGNCYKKSTDTDTSSSSSSNSSSQSSETSSEDSSQSDTSSTASSEVSSQENTSSEDDNWWASEFEN
ncbi:MAG: penicillin-binding protein [Clostridiales bacterium]|nr:penicillin-binding protein [Clostridiales bacterium]